MIDSKVRVDKKLRKITVSRFGIKGYNKTMRYAESLDKHCSKCLWTMSITYHCDGAEAYNTVTKPVKALKFTNVPGHQK